MSKNHQKNKTHTNRTKNTVTKSIPSILSTFLIVLFGFTTFNIDIEMVIRDSLGILMFVNQKRTRNHRFCPHGPPETVHHLRWFPQDPRETSIRRNCFGILMYSSQKRTKITHFNPLFWTAESFHHPSRLRWFPIGNPPLGENFRGFNVFNTKIDGSNTKLMVLTQNWWFWDISNNSGRNPWPSFLWTLTTISVNPDRLWPPNPGYSGLVSCLFAVYYGWVVWRLFPSLWCEST